MVHAGAVRARAAGGDGGALCAALFTVFAASASIEAESRTASVAISSPSPARTSSSVEAEPSSTALAWAPRSSDSAVVSGDVRRRPRSRSITLA